MLHDIEANYKEEHQNEEQQCRVCESFKEGFCKELEQPVPLVAHCDFFSSKD